MWRSCDRFPSFKVFFDLYRAAQGPVQAVRSEEITVGGLTTPEQALANVRTLKKMLKGLVKTVDDG